MSRVIPVNQWLLPVEARTSGGVSSWINVMRSESLLVHLIATAASGTDEGLGLSLVWKPDDATDYKFTSHELVRAQAAGNLFKAVPVVGRYFRVEYELTGTSPSFTFGVYLGRRE